MPRYYATEPTKAEAVKMLRRRIAERAQARADRERAELENRPVVHPVPKHFGEWIANARPEYRWDYRHFRVMQRELDRVTSGELKRLYFQVSIRHGKTEHNTISYAAYRLELDPTTRILVTSYNTPRARKFSREIRKLARKRGVQLSNEINSASEWETIDGGGVQAIGAAAGAASINADLIIIDDPIGKRKDAESQQIRDTVWEWLTNDILARTQPSTAVIMTMSRWHTDDPAGRLLDQQKDLWTFVDLPAESEGPELDKELHRPKGEPLWPEVLDREWIKQKKRELGEYGFASLCQGRPRPRSGGMFKWEWWKLANEVPKGVKIVRYWDLAGTEPDKNKKGHDPDYTAGAAACMMPDKRTMIVDVVRFRLSVAARDASIVEQARLDVQRFGAARVVYWFEAETGIAGAERTAELTRAVQNVGIKVESERPSGDKVVRAEPLASKAGAGNVVLGPETPHTKGWRNVFRLEAAYFPNGEHDDQIDAAVGANAKVSAEKGGYGTGSYAA